MSTVSSTSSDTTSAQALMAASTVSSSSSSSSTTSSSSSSSSSASTIQDTFLKMLVAQMNNQDPLNPMDNSELTSQMAQISSLEGIENLNTTLSAFTASSNSNTPVGVSNLIGDNVLSSGSSVTLSSSASSAQVGFSLDSSASTVTAKLVNSSGEVVDTKTFSNVAAGTQGFTWTGTDADGNAYGSGSYTMSVTASGSATATPLTLSTVVGVTQGSSGPMVQLANGSAVALSTIKGVFPGSTTTSSSSTTSN